MAPRKLRAPRVATSKRVNTLHSTSKRRRPANDPKDAPDHESGDEERLPRQNKKPKPSPTSEDGSADGESSLVDAESSTPADPMDVDPIAGGPGESDRGLKHGIDNGLPPISEVREMFEDMIQRLNPVALKNNAVQLNVATICSGTDAPIFALGLIQDAIQAMSYGIGLEFQHLFSCEIEPFKQGFIRRNLPEGTLIFRDVVEMATAAVNNTTATTASGSKAEIPANPLDILFAGCSCVDYSNINQNKPEASLSSFDNHLRRRLKKKSRNQAPEEEELPPVKLDPGFINDLDKGLEELKELKTGGESARTFFAAVKLITKLLPKAVILENVCGAPWDMYTKRLFPKVGYVARFVRLDSKDFYLPQTRQRGYLVAINALEIGEKLAGEIASEWVALLSKCKRPASAPITAFLRPSDDPATIQARADMESKSSCNNAEWALCLLRHNDARQKNGLRRDDNPFSKKAMRNGRVIFAAYPSHSWLRFWEPQVARVVDLMDIAFATANKEGVDLAYKTAMIDVSQNVDRNAFARPGVPGLKKLGIVGCITPTGMPVLTDLLRPVTGSETLSLQGLPVDELVISTETQAQLRDLAGNAMTVTVVGAAALAIILAASKLKADMFEKVQSQQSRRGLYLEHPQEELMEPGRANSMSNEPGQLLAIAKDMMRMCYCPTQAKGVFVCNACGTTACSGCRGNPEHDFGVEMAVRPAYSANKGKIGLRRLLPSTLVLLVPASVVRHGLGSVKEELYRSVVSDILTTNPTYYFDEIKVTEAVAVCYKAANSIARRILSADSVCCWYIYIAPWHSARAKLSEIFDLDQPIARGQLFEDNSSPQWSIWALGRIDLTLQLAKDAAGFLVASNLTFAGDHNANARLDASLVAWKETVERKVHGTYVHHPKCGTAGCSLRIKQSPTTVSKVFMMWESARLGAGTDDHFVWAEMARRTEPHEYREILLHANPTISWKVDSGLGTVAVSWPGYWSSSSDAPNTAKMSIPEPIQDLVQVYWGLTETIQQALCHMSGQAPATHMPVLATLTGALRQFPISPARLSKINSTLTDGSFYVIPTAGRDAFLKLFAFLSSEVRMTTAPDDLTLFQHLLGVTIPVGPCHDCSVAPPEIIVHTKTERNKEGKEDKNAKKIKVIFEDPDEAANFERQFQDLPRAVAVAARLFCEVDGIKVLQMRIMLQPKTLASRALAYLRQVHRTASRGSLALNPDAKTSFTVTLDYASSPTAGFAPFRDSLQPCGKDSTVGVDLISWNGKAPESGPPRFCREAGPGRKNPAVQYSLRPSQRDAVHWMLQRELAPLDFVKAEVEEEVVQPLNLRVTGRAEWTNRFPYSSRGGVIAHEIGYGKTVVTLALIDYMREFDTGDSIAERQEMLDGAWSQELPQPFDCFGDADAADCQDLKADSFLCHLSATLVIVPKHITDQWAKEAGKFLGLKGKPRLLVIKTSKAFYESHTLDALKEAEIIIVSSAVFGSGFMDRLQTIAGRGTDYLKGLSGRTLEVWYQRALRNHRTLVAFYLAGRAANIPHEELMRKIWEELLPGLIKKQQKEINILLKKQVFEIDRRFYKDKIPRGHSNETARATQGGSGSSKLPEAKQEAEEAKPIGAGDWNISWLHSCSFARVVWDECSYDGGNHIPLFMANAVANAKWLISGTPKLFDLGEVCKIADAFGIHVARPEPRMFPGLPPVTKGLELDQMTKSEQFHVFSSPVKSVELARERHSRAQDFVGAYFRANALESDLEVQFEEHVRPVAMTSSTSVRYHLLNQEILDAGYDYTALPAHARAEVALKGRDLVNTDGPAAAKMLLGLLACGLCRERSSIENLERDLSERNKALDDQMKFLWDKMMWLRRWILGLKPEDAKFQFSEPVQDTLDRVNLLSESLRKALLGSGASQDSGDKGVLQCEAVVVAGLPKAKPEELEMHFRKGWAEHYNETKALYTWLDFFDVELSTLGKLTEPQLRLLAEDLRWLRFKANPHPCALLAERELSDTDFLASLPPALAPRGKGGRSRAIPQNIGSLVADGHQLLGTLEKSELQQSIQRCIEAKMELKEASKPAGIATGPWLKERLTERLTELNLKIPANYTAAKLKILLSEHENGLTGCDQYRDGRAAPNGHRGFEAATSSGSTTARQIDATNLELKHTMVHLAKTVEDLRATRLEANFVPAYSSLADGTGKLGDLLEHKFCDGCRQPLTSVPSTFLVVACGHFLCGECKSGAGFYCPAEDCPAFIRKRPVLRCSQVRPPDAGKPCLKADYIANFIKTEIPKGDHVLVFAQYRPLIETLAKAFESVNLSYTNLAATKDEAIAGKLENFKVGKAGQVLLLDIDSETSAGSNLTIATHVIFANPYVHYDEEHQARTVSQARGRCIRFGQTKKVHVHHFLVPGTIEEETLRKLGRGSPAVQDFFENQGSLPWWMDNGGEDGSPASNGDQEP